MEKKNNHCSACNAEIPATVLGGLCPKCLLMGATSKDAPGPRSAPGDLDDDMVTMSIDEEMPADFTKAAASASSFAPSQPLPVEKKGAADFAPSQEEMEQLFPDLEILSLLGTGGMGAVYKARQKRLDRLVALKVLSCPPEMHESFSLRFEREAQLLAKLLHPNIVTIFDFGEIRENGPGGLPLFYFMMEYVDGSDLSKRIRAGSLTAEETLSIVPQICDALQVAHDLGITHRDVKPANMLLDSQGQVRVADFGVAKIVDNEDDLMTGLTLTGTTMGTPHYMAPEQWDAPEKVDHRSDIYSLGVIFYQMLTSERPVGRFLPPSQKVAVDPRIDDVVFKALETKRKDRYQNARDMAEEVREVVATDTSRNSAGKKIALGLIASAVIGAGVWWGIQPDREVPQAETTLKAEIKKRDEIAYPKETPPLQSTSLAYPPGKWVQILKTQAELDSALFANRGENTIRDGWVDGSTTESTPTLRFPAIEAQNGGLRLRLKISDRKPLPTVLTINLRSSNEEAAVAGLSAYRLSIFGMHRDELSISSGYYQFDSNEWTPLSTVKSTPLPVPGDEFDVEFYTIGSRIMGRFNGQPLDIATDTRLVSGQVMLQNPHLIRDVEFINLDGLSETEALRIAGFFETEPTTHNFTTGRLRAAGLSNANKPFDLSSAEPFDDIVDIASNGYTWVALRENGETLSSNPNLIRKGIKALTWQESTPPAFLTKDGTIEIFENSQWHGKSAFPASLEKTGVEQFALGSKHGVALLRNGDVEIWGPRYERAIAKGEVLPTYESETWPPPPLANDLKNTISVAATTTHAAALREDGSVIIWGHSGIIDSAAYRQIHPIKTIKGSGDSFYLLTESNEIYRFRVPRSTDPDSPTGTNVRLEYVSSGTSLTSTFYLNEDGKWKAFSLLENSGDLLARLPSEAGVVACGNSTIRDGETQSWLLWIEPSASAAPSKPPTSSKANLPPALAAMKERGGQLRQWHSERDTPIDISAAAGARNLIALNGSLTPTEPRWLVRTSTGESITSLTDFDRSSELIALGSHNGLLRDGTLLHCWKTQRELNANNIADADFCKNSNNLQFELLQHDNGTVSMRPHGKNSAWNGEEFAEIREKIAQIKDAAAIDCGWGAAAVLRANGEVFSWGSLDGIVKSAPQISTAVEIAVGPETWAARLADGTVKVWLNFKEHNNGSSLYMSPPDDLAPAFAIRVSQKVCAAQMADGTWRAWGRDDSGLIEKINSLGPAVDILFVTTSQLTEGGGLKQQDSKLLWIEPAKPEDTIPLSPPGKLTATGTYSNGEPIDISRAKGINDFVKVVLQRSGWIGLREDGTTISSDGLGDRENIVDIYPAGHVSFTVKSSDRSLEVLSSYDKLEPKLNDEIPEEIRRQTLVDYFGVIKHYTCLLENGSISVWGDYYDHPERLPEWANPETAWPRPPAEAAENVISIGGGITHAGTVTADGKLWLWDHEGLIDLGEFEKLQGDFVSLGKSTHHGTDALLNDGRILQINRKTGRFSLIERYNSPSATANSGYRPLYQAPEGEWYTTWPTKGIEPFLETLKSRPPEEFSMNTSFIEYGPDGEKISIGLITIDPPHADSGASNEIADPHLGNAAGEERLFEISPGVEIPFLWCPPGKFTMGSPEKEIGRKPDEIQHEVILTKGYWLAKTEFTREDWLKIPGNTPRGPQGRDPRTPVTHVSWDMIAGENGFLKKIAQSAPKGWQFNLPTEAQWEYACRAGTSTLFFWGKANYKSEKHQHHLYANLADVNSSKDWAMKMIDDGFGDEAAPVGTFQPNPWGFLDMTGNVNELCRDWKQDHTGETVTDPVGPAEGEKKVTRGGNFINGWADIRSASRTGIEPDLSGSPYTGFRLVLEQN
ncbi:MAG: bifunctional serine/threonine-protein kinase/formylglycine-generating enzyme family protein [Verrucomicrobiales bacterium]|nr:bifunctional serine/threonine-protein kinase/formylglycine-generating enzyme family protein [Verrucomicrobiales bacterium]